MFDYGNARVWALHARLLDKSTLFRLEEAGSAGAFLALLERAEDWRPIVRHLAPLAADPAAAASAAIEWHRAARLGALPEWYPSSVRPLVEALVLPLDLERLLEALRRRRAGEDAERVVAAVAPGALLHGRDVAAIARAPRPADALGIARRVGIITRDDVAAALRALEADGPRAFEAALVAAVGRARGVRCAGAGGDHAAVRSILADEAAVADRVLVELHEAGTASASAVERTQTLARLDLLERRGRRDRLGVGSAAGYVAAVEAQAIRVRAALARVVAGWSSALVAGYRAVGVR